MDWQRRGAYLSVMAGITYRSRNSKAQHQWEFGNVTVKV